MRTEDLRRRAARATRAFLERRLAPTGPAHDDRGFVRREHVPGAVQGTPINVFYEWVVKTEVEMACRRCGWVARLPLLRPRAAYATGREHLAVVATFNRAIEAFVAKHRGCQ